MDSVGTGYQFDPRGAGGHYAYDAWGQLMAGTNSTPYGYKGQWGYYTDGETGLLLLTYRYLDPTTGRFLTRDPIGYEGGMNLYAYVGNGVIGGKDPAGFVPTFIGCTKRQEQELRKHLRDICEHRLRWIIVEVRGF